MAIDPKYTILPLDEDYFEIDANSRKITVPEAFRKNGIAVKGDQVAEILYFRINRYFDFTDLDTTTIVIQWETADQTNVSGIWVKDIESDPDYLIFGWPLDDQITQTPGLVRFSVRFVQWDDKKEKIIYSLSTLEAQAMINNALDLSDLTFTSEVNDMIKNRVQNTEYQGVGPIPVSPVFTLDLTNEKKDLINGKYPLKVQAISEDTGTISYSWRKYSVLDTANIDEAAIIGSPVIHGGYEYKNISRDTEGNRLETVPVINGPYFVQDENDNTKYVIDGSIKAGEAMPENKDIFEQYGKYEADTIGQYWAVASNSRGLKHTDKLSSKFIIIPGPSKVGYKLKEDKLIKIMEADEFKGTISYELSPVESDIVSCQWYKNNEVCNGQNTATLEIYGDDNYTDVQGNYFLEIKSERNGGEEFTKTPSIFISYPALKPQIRLSATQIFVNDIITVSTTFEKDYQKNNEITYKWIKVEQDGETDADNTMIEAIEGYDNQFKIIKAGVYKCEVTNTYNGQVKTDISDRISCN